MLYEDELQAAKTQEEYIKVRWRQAFEILAVMPDERHAMGYKPSLPAFIRPYDDDYWKEWGQSQQYIPNPREIDQAIEATRWIHYAAAQGERWERPVIVGIITLISRGCSLRETAKRVGKKARKGFNKDTCSKRFNKAVADVIKGGLR